MKEFSPKPNLKKYARTALAASLLTAGLSACGDGPKEVGSQPTVRSIATEIPTLEPQRTTITGTWECITPQGPQKSTEQITQETILEHGGAIVLTVKGLENCFEFVPIVFRRLDAPLGDENPYNNGTLSINGSENGADRTSVIPATSCTGIYEVGVIISKTEVEMIPVLDKNTGEYKYVFTLDEDCTRKIETSVHRPTLN